MDIIATGFKRIYKALVYSYDGFISAFRSEIALRQDIIFCVIFLGVALFVPVSVIEKILMIFSLFLIVLMELINTAIETIVNRISYDYHPLSKKAKDIGSLLVLLSFTNTFIIWGWIIYDNFFAK